jgi:hypothetical protein
MDAVRTVLYIVSFEPLGSRGTGDIEDLGDFAAGQAGVLDFFHAATRNMIAPN